MSRFHSLRTETQRPIIYDPMSLTQSGCGSDRDSRRGSSFDAMSVFAKASSIRHKKSPSRFREGEAVIRYYHVITFASSILTKSKLFPPL